MKIPIRPLVTTLALAGLFLLAVPGSAAGPAPLGASAAAPAAEALAPETATPQVTVSPTQDALDQAWPPQYGDCALYCGSFQNEWVYHVTREQCCSGTLTCASGSPAFGYAFYPYQGYAEFCSV